MHTFLIELLKYEPSIAIISSTTKMQLVVLSTDPLPSNQEEFKKFFLISMDTHTAMNQQCIIIGYNMLSECTIQEIKFDSTTPQFMVWLKTAKLFLELDSLGVQKTTTIGYLHPQYTNQTTLKTLLLTALENIVIIAKLVTELDPLLQDKQNNVMANSNFLPLRFHHLSYTKHNSGTTENKKSF